MEKGISKEQSKMLQGVAILMMLYHHLFSTPEMFDITYQSLLKFGNINAELHLAWFFKICVGLYAFISGYGLCRGLNWLQKEKNLHERSFFYSLGRKYIFVLKRLLNFFSYYWLVFAVCVPFRFFVYHEPFNWKEFVLNLCGISSTYNGTWWYVLFYIKMLMLLPLIDSIFMLFKRKGARICQILFYLCLTAILVSLCMKDNSIIDFLREFFMLPFMECFLMGYFLAKFKIFELCFRIIPTTLLYVLGMIGFLVTFAARIKIAKDASSVGLDYLFVPVFAFGFVVLMQLLPKISKLFLFFGKYSTFMWLTHVFFYAHATQKLIFLTGISAGIYISFVVVSLAVAIVLQFLYDKINNMISICVKSLSR